jgi:C4-dicarboxylate transporter DctQ subunit
LKQFFLKIDYALVRVQEVIAATGVIFATLVIFANAVLRYAFQASLPWAEDSVRYVMIWVVFLGCSLCVRRDMHVKIDVLLVRLPFKLEKALVCIIYMLCIAFCLFLLYYGGELVRRMRILGQISTSMLWLEMWVIVLALPVFGILGIKDYTQLIILNLMRKGEIVRTLGGGTE